MRLTCLTLFATALVACLLCPSRADAQLIQSVVGNGSSGFTPDGQPAVGSAMNSPYGVTLDQKGNLYFTDGQRVRVVNNGTSAVTIANVTIQPGDIGTVAGNGTPGLSGDGGQATSAELDNPNEVAVDGNGNIYIADWGNERVRVVNSGGVINTVTGNIIGTDSGDNGPAKAANIGDAFGVAVDSKGNLYIADNSYYRIRAVNMGTTTLTVGTVSIPPGYINTVAGNGSLGAAGDNGVATGAEFNFPHSVAVDASGNLYICDTYNREIRVVNAGTTPITVAGTTIQPGDIATVAGNSTYGFRGDGYPAIGAEFADPDGVTLDSKGNIYVSDLENARIRFINRSTGIVGTIAGIGVWSYNGDGIPATTAELNEPRTIAVDGGGNVYIADSANDRIREIQVNPGIPVITSRAGTAFTAGVQGTFTVTTGDLPISSLFESGALPSGVTFTDNRDGTGTLSGMPLSAAGSPFVITFTAINGVLPNATQTFTLTVYPSGGAPSATFMGADGSTGGTWQGVYGSDGYSLANITPQSIPSYAALAVQNQLNFTWATGTIDPRALNVPGSASRTAATWYANSIFDLDVNVGSGAHQIALYAVDWDGLGRAETIQIEDVNSGAILDTETISNFVSGVYLVWNITGHVQVIVLPSGAPNGVVSAIFFGGASVLPAPILNITKTHTDTLTQGQQGVTYKVTVSNLLRAATTSGPVTVTEIPPAGLSLASMAGTGWACSGSSCSRSDSLTAAASYPSITVTMNVAANASSPQVNQASVSGGGSLGTVIASDTATVAPSATVAQVGFVRADTTTQGNWQSTYGGDGYSIANVGSFVIPPYASLFLENQINYTWISGISDPRALVSDTAGDRIASAWYNPTSFSFDISTDGNPHQIALYFLDWDSQGRAETVQVVDANSGAPLDTRNIPGSNTSTTGANFVGGTYMVWVISGHVTITITANSGPNAVVSGIFFGGPTQTAPAITSASSTTFNVGKPATFAVTSTGYPTSALSETGALPGGVTFVDNGNGTGTLSGTPAANSASSYSIVFTANNGVSPNATENFTLTVNQPVSSGPSATFVSPDTVTQGNWMGVYGADGYDVANGPQSPAGGTLSYGSYSVQNQSNWTWAASTSDQRALQTDSQGDRIAATWYNPTVFNFDVNLTGTHQVALYVLDWDSQGRGETIQITDANNPGSLLDRRSIPATGMTSANFVNGTYLVWNISGHVTITVTTNSGPNAVVAGIFFGGAGTVTQPAQATASWVKSNTATEGTWMGVYGSQGYSLATAGSNFQSISIPATFSVQGQSNWAWASPTTDTRALETDTQGDRAAATWYSPSSFSFALNLTDGQTHQVAIYVIDWDSKGRAETISIADANSGKVLDARSIPNANAGSATYTNTTSANFFGGTYLIWNVSGSVTITITSNSGPNAVASGVFLDQ